MAMLPMAACTVALGHHPKATKSLSCHLSPLPDTAKNVTVQRTKILIANMAIEIPIKLPVNRRTSTVAPTRQKSRGCAMLFHHSVMATLVGFATAGPHMVADQAA